MPLYSSNNNNNENDAYTGDDTSWKYYSSDASSNSNTNTNSPQDWMSVMEAKQDGSFWSAFEPSAEDATMVESSSNNQQDDATDEDAESNAWLETLANLSAEEVQFNQKEGERADMLRKMEEYQFSPEVIAATLGVATDTSLEDTEETAALQTYRQSVYDSWDQVDLETVESHTRVAKDPDTDQPIRSQMVYVDEVTCIGCTNCAMVAQSTFFMHSEHGRARVFQQWGDDDETIQIAIETCPVDCIHYVPYEELVELEKERRGQNINFKARLVNQSDNISNTGQGFTGPQKISGNSAPRCNNCPSRGCRNCPMYGVGKNPEFEHKEKLRLEKRQRRQLERERKSLEKQAEL